MPSLAARPLLSSAPSARREQGFCVIVLLPAPPTPLNMRTREVTFLGMEGFDWLLNPHAE